jgi:hypothetical protein
MNDVTPYFSDEINVTHLKRDRGFFSKTFGIAWKIAKSKGDIYHCSYCLQDAFFTSKLKHLDIVHAHGSDIRWTLDSRYGWLVKSALKNARIVLYATPDLEAKIKLYRSDAMYSPTPVDTKMFSPKRDYGCKPSALYFRQCYEDADSFSPLIQAIRGGFDLTIQDRNVPYEKMPEFLKTFDVFVDRFSIPSYSKTCLEAMSCGLATIDYRHFGSLGKRLSELDASGIYLSGIANRKFVEANHNAKTIGKALSELYLNLYEEKKCS